MRRSNDAEVQQSTALGVILQSRHAQHRELVVGTIGVNETDVCAGWDGLSAWSWFASWAQAPHQLNAS